MEYLALLPTGLLGLLWWLIQQKDTRRHDEILGLIQRIKELTDSITKTSEAVTSEREKTAKLVMEEKEKLAALVLSERDKLAALVKAEHDRLADKLRNEQEKIKEEFHRFEINLAREYARTELVEKMLLPIMEGLKHIEKLMQSKLDRREFDQHKEEMRDKQ